jgi:hypothetical protein
MFGLFIVMGGLAHYGALYLSWKRQREFMERYIRNARRMAWGDETGIQGILGLDGNAGTTTSATTSFGMPSASEESGVAGSNRRQRRMQERADKRAARDPKAAKTTKEKVEVESTPAPRGTKKRVVAENGKILIVDSVGNVYLEQTTEEGEVHEYLLDPNEIQKPTIYDTALLRLPIWAYGKFMARFSRSSSSTAETEMEADDDDDATIKQDVAAHPNGKKQRRKPATVHR